MALTGSEPARLTGRLNWLRAAVLGANDGIVSVASLVMGVAGAAADSRTLLIAGVAGLVSGALSMAGGEFVSVSSQADTELAALAAQRARLASDPTRERHALARAYAARGLEPSLALQVAEQLTRHDAVAAHAETRLGIQAGEQTSPWAAATASLIAFALGAFIPLVLMLASPPNTRVLATMLGVELALCLTGLTGARLGGASAARPVLRNMLVGSLGMCLTYTVGTLFSV
ncbi:VIT family protein [Brooklawnia cerclae]